MLPPGIGEGVAVLYAKGPTTLCPEAAASWSGLPHSRLGGQWHLQGPESTLSPPGQQLGEKVGPQEAGCGRCL